MPILRYNGYLEEYRISQSWLNNVIPIYIIYNFLKLNRLITSVYVPALLAIFAWQPKST